MLFPRIFLSARIIAVLWAVFVGVTELAIWQEWIVPSASLQPWIWGISVGMLAAGSIGNVIRDAVGKRFNDKRSLYDNVLTVMLAEICDDTGLRLGEVGCSVYKLSRFSRRKPEGTRCKGLKRVHRHRILGVVSPSTVQWHVGKGEVGMAAMNQRTFHRNLHALSARYPKPIDEPTFEKLSTEARRGLSFPEFNSLTGKYSEVLAVPITSGNPSKLLGVLSIDRKFDPEVDPFIPCLGNSKTQDTASAAAATVASIMTQGQK